MRQVTVEYIENRLRLECIVAPITIPKIVRTFENDNELMHIALNMYHEGKLVNYHMLPGNGHLEF